MEIKLLRKSELCKYLIMIDCKYVEFCHSRSEITHVWKGTVVAKGSVHSAQMVLDGVSYLSDAITSIGSQPTKLLSDWVADKVAPTYWRPNSEIKVGFFFILLIVCYVFSFIWFLGVAWCLGLV